MSKTRLARENQFRFRKIPPKLCGKRPVPPNCLVVRGEVVPPGTPVQVYNFPDLGIRKTTATCPICKSDKGVNSI